VALVSRINLDGIIFFSPALVVKIICVHRPDSLSDAESPGETFLGAMVLDDQIMEVLDALGNL
jgi:hypothetical protein